MERLRKRVDTAKRALKTLQELLEVENPTTVERDAVIQRFEWRNRNRIKTTNGERWPTGDFLPDFRTCFLPYQMLFS